MENAVPPDSLPGEEISKFHNNFRKVMHDKMKTNFEAESIAIWLAITVILKPRNMENSSSL